MPGRWNTSKALEKRLEKAKKLEDKIIEKMGEHPYGLTVYELANLLKTTPAGIIKAISRISNKSNEIGSKERKGKKQVAKYYFLKKGEGTSNYSEIDTSTGGANPRHDSSKEGPSNYFEIDISDQKIKWKSIGIIYADIRNSKVLLYPKQIPELDKQFFSEKISLYLDSEKLSWIVPEKISYTFDAENRESKSSIMKDHIEIEYTEKKIESSKCKLREILILDDLDVDPAIQNIKRVLGKNHNVELVRNQIDAINKIQTKKFDFLILDWFLGGEKLEHKKIMKEFRRKNAYGKAVIITGQNYGRDEVIEYASRSITWFFSKTRDKLPELIEEEMRKVMK